MGIMANYKREKHNVFEVVEMTGRQEFFNELAENWDNRFQTQELITFLDKLVPMFYLREGERILDVGTGTGILIPYLLQAVGSKGHITAIDYADRMVKVCKSKYGHFSNVIFAVQNIEKIDYSSESFDAVICFGVFPHLENPAKALSKINRVLKKEGKLIISHALSSQEIRAHHQSSSLVVAQDVLPKKTEMRQILKQTGFCKITIIDEPGRYLCVSFKASD